MFHDLEDVGSIHIPYNWSYADAATREAATGFVAAEVGRLARQLDDNSLWMLLDVTPTWFQIGGAAPDAWVSAPTTASDPGTAGQKAYDVDGFLYVCIATDTWVRFAGGTW